MHACLHSSQGLDMNLTNAQITGLSVAVLGFVFAGAYAVASHHPDTPVPSARPSDPFRQVQAVDPSVPEASVVFRNNNNPSEEQPATF